MKFICIIVGLLLLIPIVLADRIGIGQGSNWVDILEWEEVIHVKNNGLEVSLALNGMIRGKDRYGDSFEFYLSPERPTERYPRDAKIKSFNACLGRKNGHNYDYIPLNCKKNLSFYPKEGGWYDDWTYVVNVSNITKDKWVAINLVYTVPNFINEDGSVKIFRLTSNCFPMGDEPQHCPGEKMVSKHIMLPPGTAIQEFPEGADTQPRDGGWRITLRDFTPEERSDKQYADIIISYIDNNKIKEEKLKDLKNNILVAVIVGLITGILSTLIVEFIRIRMINK